MSTRAKASLQLLRDVEGSMGSFLVNNESDLVDRDAPAYFKTEALTTVGRRIANSLASGQLQLPGTDELTLRFARGAVVGRRCKHGTIVLMADQSLHGPTARIALAVCARQLDGLDDLRPLPDPTPVETAPDATRAKKKKSPKKPKPSIWA